MAGFKQSALKLDNKSIAPTPDSNSTLIYSEGARLKAIGNVTGDIALLSDITGGGGNGFTPVAGDGISITAPTSSSYQFSVVDYIGKTEVASISSGLNTKITNIQNNYTLLSTTALISAGLVKKTGDTMTGELVFSNAGIQTDINYTPAYQEGKIFYDNQQHTLAYYNEDSQVKVNVGQEQLVRVRNQTASTITNGSVVCISGSSGSSPLIVLASNNDSIAHNTLGVATHDIDDNDHGYITVNGLVNNLDTSSFSTEGIVLWLGTNGNLTETIPVAPNHKIKIGYLVRKHNTQGQILVSIEQGSDLSSIHDVTLTNPQQSQLLTYQNGIWVNADPSITKTEVASISAGLNTKITNIQNNYALSSVVAGISSGLQTQITNNLNNFNNYALTSTVSAISSGLQSQINSDRANYTLLTTTAAISSGLNNRINNINIIAGSNITVNKAFDNVYTISATSAGGSGGSSTYAGLTDVSLTSPVTGQMPVYNGNVWVNKYPTRNIPFTIVSSTAITSGTKDTMFVAPWNGNITDWQITCTPSSTITLDILKANNAVPTTSIISSNYPSVSASQIASSNNLTGWTTSFNKNDVLKIKVNSNNSATIITLQLNCSIEG